MTLNLKALALSGGRRLWAALKVITRLGYRGVCAGVSVLCWFLASVDWEGVGEDISKTPLPFAEDPEPGELDHPAHEAYYGYGWDDVHK